MGTHLQQLLRSVCWKTEWDYAVFWKLKHCDQMVLTWEDGYYDNQDKLDPSESKIFDGTVGGSHDGQLGHDSLGLAMAKMSCQVYSLGEGGVGQVAVSGMHQWILAGEHAMNAYSSFELCDGWQAQFAAGIKTVVVAAVVPHGVIQFGSRSRVTEKLHFLAHIRDVFSSLQESTSRIQHCGLQNMFQMSDISSRIFSPNVLQNYRLDKAANNGYFGTLVPMIPSEAVGLISKDRGHITTAKLVQPPPEIKQSTDLPNDSNYSSNSSKIRNGGINDNKQICYPSQSCITENSPLYGGKTTHHFEEKINELLAADPIAQQKMANNMEILSEFSCLETSGNLKPSFVFSAGTELHEALGPAFLKQCYPLSRKVEKPEDSFTSVMPEVIESSKGGYTSMGPQKQNFSDHALESSTQTSDSGQGHLLEDVVANFCLKNALKKSKSFSTSDSMLTTEKMPEPSITTSRTFGSSCYSAGCSSLIEENMQNCLRSSVSYSIRSSTSECREHLVRSVESGKPNKKRARPGENSRPRPRDRQLIQDRIKELRELVPNGSKCSIESLLEKTIKHMGFMQNVAKHSDKLSNCAKSKGGSEVGMLASDWEKGSSWAVEVGGHMKSCPILVENLNTNGQMLIEMFCDDCDHILEITENIRSLGLTILTGITDRHGDKTWMRFVVEGESNRSFHRMDVLWSLVQILQSKTTVQKDFKTLIR